MHLHKVEIIIQGFITVCLEVQVVLCIVGDHLLGLVVLQALKITARFLEFFIHFDLVLCELAQLRRALAHVYIPQTLCGQKSKHLRKEVLVKAWQTGLGLDECLIQRLGKRLPVFFA